MESKLIHKAMTARFLSIGILEHFDTHFESYKDLPFIFLNYYFYKNILKIGMHINFDPLYGVEIGHFPE